MFVTFRGSVSVLALTAADWHVQLVHPSLSDVLVLTTFLADSEPYRRSIEGWAKDEGRSVTGGLRVNGPAVQTEVWDFSFLVKRPQFELFNQMLGLQRQSPIPISLLDRFTGLTDATNVWLSVDQSYLTPAVLGQWWTLQFRALEEV
jgi:hypothetical protein